MHVRRLSLLLLALVFLCKGPTREAHGHGGIPAPQQILWRGDDMLVPTPYWGLFVGSRSGPWHWICDEAINAYQQHTFAVGGDGTLYATDRAGMQVSRDGGCSWDAITGPLATLYILSVQGTAASPRVWALASGDAGGASLWTSDDSGASWQQQQDLPGAWPSGLRIADGGQMIVAGVMTAATPRQAQLLLSRDAGETFSSLPVGHLVGGQPLAQITPLWIDPREPQDIWVAGRVDTVTVLLQIQPGTAPIEHLRLSVNIFDMLRDPQTGALLVATATGLYTRSEGSAFAALSTVSTSRCLSAGPDGLYACAWNFQPDLAAVVQLSAMANQRTRIFQYQDTQGPQSCPADTPVARICPMAWNIYADQLGIDTKKKPPVTAGGCSQGTGPRADHSGWLLLLALPAVLTLCRRSRRYRTT